MWQELADIPLEVPEIGDEFFAEPFTLQGITFPAGITRTELWHWFDEHHPKGVAYLLYEKNKQRESLDENGKVWLDAVPSFWKGKQYEICRENI